MLLHAIPGSLIAALFYVARCDGNPTYSENVDVRSLQDGKILAHFTFARSQTVPSLRSQGLHHFDLLPRQIAEITQTFKAPEWHLSFTQGRWDMKRWGPPPRPAPTGAELYAWLDGEYDVNANWAALASALSGLFCASLNFIDHSNTAFPIDTFTSEGSYEGDDIHIRHATLPREAACTENLTPWLKLLPCQAKAGIAQLLNPHRVFDGNYHSMAIDVRWKCLDDSCSLSTLEVDQSFTAVLDPLRSEGYVGRSGDKGWDIFSLFDRKIEKRCLIADSSTIGLVLPDINSQSKLLSPASQVLPMPESGTVRAVYDAKGDLVSELGVREALNFSAGTFSSSVEINRYLTGHGQEKGGVAIHILNRNSNYDAVASLLESYPWWLRVYLHTLKVETREGTIVVPSVHYQPARDRERPSLLYVHLNVPANCSLVLSFDFDKSHLRYTEHPPDASRGFDLGASVASVGMWENAHDPSKLVDPVLAFRSAAHTTRMYTDPILVALPTPDFSMPYNVVTMTCTLLAFLFGSVFNMLTRRFNPVVVEQQKTETGDGSETSER